MSSPNHAATLLVLTLASIVGPLFAQGERRTELKPAPPVRGPARESGQPTAWIPVGAEHVVNRVERDQDLPDEPDFVPVANTFDATGRVNGMRRAGNPYVLAFTNGAFTPKPGVDPRLLEALRDPRRTHTWGFVMFEKRMSQERYRVLRELGVEICGVHTWQSVKVRIPASAVGAVAGLPFVRWVGYARPEQKLQKHLAQALATAPDEREFEVYVQPFESDLGDASKVQRSGEARDTVVYSTGQTEQWIPNGPFQQRLEALGFRFDWYVRGIHCFKGRATKAQILRIRELDFVHTVELYEPAQAQHDQALAMISQDRVRGRFPGTRVPVGIIDSGVDGSPWHKDFAGKYWIGFRTTSVSAFADGNGHGTHVTGTVLGRGISDSKYTGCAPAVGRGGFGDGIFIGRYLKDNGFSQGNVEDLYIKLGRTYTNSNGSNPRPTVVNNSWGRAAAGGYNGTDAQSRVVDKYVYDKNQVYVFAAGNKKSTANWWAATPACAKNVLTVGGVNDTFSATVKAGGVYSSSRWNTTDGRVKPEVSAPASIVTSCDINTNIGYSDKSGTSMAAPMVTGAVASLVDRNPGFYQYQPATVRALMCATATIGGTPTTHWGSRNLRTGHGVINSYMLNYDTFRYKRHIWRGTFTRSGQYYTATLPVSTYLKAMKVVLSWVEFAPSSSASAARINSLQCRIDAPPYTGRSNTGDATTLGSADTTRFIYWTGSSSMITAMKGKSVQFKVRADSMVRGSGKWALCVVQHLALPTGSSAYAPILKATASHTMVKPNDYVTVDCKLTTRSTAGEFDNARIYFNGPANWRVQQLHRTTADSILQKYDRWNTHYSSPFPNVGLGKARGMVIGQGSVRSLKYLISTLTNGSHNIYIRAQWHGGIEVSDTARVCVDGLRPKDITGLTSTTHTPSKWNKSGSVLMKWSKPEDVGCAGIDGLAYTITTSPSAPVNKIITGAATSRSMWITSGKKYVNMRAIDKLGNLSSRTATAGPYFIDLTRPGVSRFELNGNATTTKSLSVNVTVRALDTFSGPDQMRFSADNSTWSTWQAFSINPVWIDLTKIGATTASGPKTCWVQVRDKAGNESATVSDGIIYLPVATLTGGTLTSLPSVGHGAFSLSGSGLKSLTHVTFGTARITQRTSTRDTRHDWWATGAFIDGRDTTLTVYPPQGLPPGTYKVTATNASGTGPSVNVTITRNTGLELYTHKRLAQQRPFTLMVTNGSLAASVPAIVTFSFSKTPSVIPNLVSFDIGAGFTQLFEFPALPFDGNGVLRLSFPTTGITTGPKGLSIYFQAVYLDPSRRQLPVSNVAQMLYR